jgi:hypothetical protein
LPTASLPPLLALAGATVAIVAFALGALGALRALEAFAVLARAPVLAGALVTVFLVAADAFFPGIRLGLHGFEDGVEIELIAQVHELLAQRRDVNLARDVDDHLY